MTIVVTILIWVLAAGLGLFVLAMVTPLRIELMLTREDAVHGLVALRPFGRLGPRVALSGRKKRQAAPKVALKKRAKGRVWQRNPQRIARAAIRLVTEILGRVHVDAASLDMRFGLGDPGETGQAFGLMTPLIYGTSAMQKVDVKIEPVFDRAVLTGHVALDLSLIPAALLAPFLRFGWTAFGPNR